MKTSSIIRRLAALSTLAGKTSVSFPAIIGDVGAFAPFSAEFVCNYSQPTIRQKKCHNHHKYGCQKEKISTCKGNNATLELAITIYPDISQRNFGIIYDKYCSKALVWEEYLHLQKLLLSHLEEQLTENPENKRVAIDLKKLKRSFKDSLTAYQQFIGTTYISLDAVPAEPIFDELCIKYDDSKFERKMAYKDYDKRLKNSRRLARKNKNAERNFWLSQYQIDSDEETVKEAEQYVYDYEKYSEAKADLIKAEKALNSPCVEEAAWAIHISINENNPDIIVEKAETIAEANKIIENYKKALERYNVLIAWFDYPTEI